MTQGTETVRVHLYRPGETYSDYRSVMTTSIRLRRDS